MLLESWFWCGWLVFLILIDQETVSSPLVPVLGLSGGFDHFGSCLYGIDKILPVSSSDDQTKDCGEKCSHGGWFDLCQ